MLMLMLMLKKVLYNNWYMPPILSLLPLLPPQETGEQRRVVEADPDAGCFVSFVMDSRIWHGNWETTRERTVLRLVLSAPQSETFHPTKACHIDA
jgi:hypothetical protein